VVTGGPYLFDHEPHQFLTLLEAEFVQGITHSVCEAGYPAAKLVLLREHAPLFNQGAALFFKGVASGVDLLSPTLDFGQLE